MPDGRVLPGEELVDKFNPPDTEAAAVASLIENQQAPRLALDCLATVLACSPAEQLSGLPSTVSCATCWLDEHVPAIAAEVNIDGSAFDLLRRPQIELHGWRQEETKLLQEHASQWVELAQPQAPPGSHVGRAIDNRCVALSFFPAATYQGVILYEPSGGLCAGLEMLLRNGVAVTHYFYSDIDPVARQVAKHRLKLLSQRYPELLHPDVEESAFNTLPQDVRAITQEQVQAVVSSCPKQQWLVVAGWECQDLSPAGSGAGLKGRKSSTYYPLLQLLRWFQQALHRQLPLGYLLENTAFQHNWRSDVVRTSDWDEVCTDIGPPVVVDATQLGSRAARLRNYWTNLCLPHLLSAALDLVVRPPGQTVDQLLQPGRLAMPVGTSDLPPKYPCNQFGSPRVAWPTLMAFPGSRAFRQGRPGSVWDSRVQGYTEPTPVERETALGYEPGDTASPGLSDAHRNAVLGRCMDANSLQYLYALSAAWFVRGVSSGQLKPLPKLAVAATSTTDTTIVRSVDFGLEIAQHYLTSCNMAFAAAKVEDADCSADIWDDEVTLHRLIHGVYPATADASSRNRSQKRLRYYTMQQNTLRRLMPDGNSRVVPKPEDREQIIKDTHSSVGHFGVRRTAALLLHTYWWRGLLKDVQAVVSRCQLCDRVRASFNARQAQLSPLPIIGLMYRWSCDLAGPFAATKLHKYQYVMVMVEHFSKFMLLVPLPAKEAVFTAQAFRQRVLGQFGACAECLTDRGQEWAAEFKNLLVKALIDHRLTSPLHPAADGMTERCVQTMKRCLKKMVEQEGHAEDWDEHLDWLQLGYNCSTQQSHRFDPFTLMFGVTPVVPPAVRERFNEPLMMEGDPTLVTDLLLSRAALMEQNLVTARSRLEIAQHRDTLRYAKLRDGTYVPSVTRFEPGQYVYLRTASARGQGLMIDVRPLILRVKEVRPDGSVLLEGRDGSTTVRNVINLSPCHLPDIDPELDLSQAPVDASHSCQQCGSPDDEASMLLCDKCLAGWHAHCLQPPLTTLPGPEEVFICPDCLAKGVTEAQVRDLQQRTTTAQQQLQQYTQLRRQLSPTTQQRRSDAKYRALHGRSIYKSNPVAHTGSDALVQGKLSFLGPGSNPAFEVQYSDGTSELLSARSMARRSSWLVPSSDSTPSSGLGGNARSGNPAAIAACATIFSVDSYEHNLLEDTQILLRSLNFARCLVITLVDCDMQSTLARIFTLAGMQFRAGGVISPQTLHTYLQCIPSEVYVYSASASRLSFCPALYN